MCAIIFTVFFDRKDLYDAERDMLAVTKFLVPRLYRFWLCSDADQCTCQL